MASDNVNMFTADYKECVEQLYREFNLASEPLYYDCD